MTVGKHTAPPAVPTGRQRSTFGAALSRLAGAQKSQAGVPMYTRYVNRRLGRYAAAAAYRAGLTPNQVTVLSALCTAVALALVVTVSPTPALAAVVTVLLVAGYALDSADGQLARLTGTGGPGGEWLDHVVDAVRNPALHLAILVSLYRFTDLPGWVLVLPMLFLLTTTVRFFGQMLAEQLRHRDGPRAGLVPVTDADGGQRGRSLIQLPSDPGVINLVFVLLAWPWVFTWAYVGLLGMNMLLAFASLVRRFREMGRLQAALHEATSTRGVS
ncbi:CDP-alcohol phosphatidyltransferase family protein [Phytoactinopolyspora limicola]|uniref:CDP-alcohol phosphatidyltransferase family protein n=1 Tax=Phytoactinopolyspora limicola TaxID=2715536 RepID=UPI001B7D7DE9|nr:CDP-alcohol phosphatidyltransferase family protein [Phytoactinopolyspora limicola]